VCATQPRYQHPQKSQNNDHPGGSLSDWNAVDRLDKIFNRDTTFQLRLSLYSITERHRSLSSAANQFHGRMVF
jgi:hypothetical protein